MTSGSASIITAKRFATLFKNETCIFPSKTKCDLKSNLSAKKQHLRHQKLTQKHHVNAKNPPYCTSKKSLGDDIYDSEQRKYTSVIKDIIFVVPVKTPEVYQTTYPWSRIAIPCYRTRDTSGIPSVTATQQEDAEESIFSLDGRRLDFRQRGINIVRLKDGSASKVLQR